MHLDLNLLVALDALLDERSVGAAADRLHLSQPAMSRTLGRIRRATGDAILVRSGRVMLTTPYAEQIRDEVHQLVVRAQTIFTADRDLDPATVDRTFTLLCNDVLAGALVPRLTAYLAAAAPGVNLRVLGETATSVDELRRGNADIRLSDETVHPADVRSTTVMTDHLVAVSRRVLAVDGTLAGFTALPHVVVSRRGRRRDRVDDLLEARGAGRRVVLTVPTLAMALQAVTAAGLITVVPAKLAGDQLGPALRTHPLPVPTPEIPAVLAWHTRHDRDGAHRWLRAAIGEILTSAE
ncbi:LysR family transcriptional regulator [Amycolatopsis saalfeldensis]|uniref:DNA-binding transcriptional regulator, LysR family n=1 Tax=Amycolatopsis saalfeldensis TaxID=394193 RepID=A0A1H8PU33_9PSEU|nr:LysR family transcriptional regulator [Amycolatopsis saalfeldensis]SEO45053.1 DNA-binding transcriptional regulator, LysR family [Amycolatopsis saalfeldensis]